MPPGGWRAVTFQEAFSWRVNKEISNYLAKLSTFTITAFRKVRIVANILHVIDGKMPRICHDRARKPMSTNAITRSKRYYLARKPRGFSRKPTLRLTEIL